MTGLKSDEVQGFLNLFYLVLVPSRMKGRDCGTVYKIEDQLERSSVSFQFSFGTGSHSQLKLVSTFLLSTPFHHVFLSSGMCISHFVSKLYFQVYCFYFRFAWPL